MEKNFSHELDHDTLLNSDTDAELLEIRKQLSSFELGRFLLDRGGLNGFWTYYITEHLYKNKIITNEIESFILNKASSARATQQRAKIFKEIIQKELKNNAVLCSVPCGVMGDLLDLDYSAINDFKLIGIDIDAESIEHAANHAVAKGLNNNIELIKQDAWSINFKDEFDLISSNGLNIYVQDNNKLIELYKVFYNALKSGGLLVTSTLTPPPVIDANSEWDMSKINLENLMFQKKVFVDVLKVKWQFFRSTAQITEQLQIAGFKDIQVFYDEARIFPTVVARKNN